MAAATTDRLTSSVSGGPRGRSARVTAGADRLTVILISAAVFLVVLAFLASRLSAAVTPVARRVVVVRRIYETKVVETIRGGGSGTSVSQSVSSSGSGAVPSAPVVTRSSTAP